MFFCSRSFEIFQSWVFAIKNDDFEHQILTLNRDLIPAPDNSIQTPNFASRFPSTQIHSVGEARQDYADGLLLEKIIALDCLLNGLSHNARAAFLLHRVDGMPYAEIAQELGVTVSSVKKYIAKALLHCATVD